MSLPSSRVSAPPRAGSSVTRYTPPPPSTTKPKPLPTRRTNATTPTPSVDRPRRSTSVPKARPVSDAMRLEQIVDSTMFKNPSILSQIASQPRKAAAGVGYLANQIYTQPQRTVMAGADAARALGVDVPGESNLDTSGNEFQDFQARWREYMPLAADMSGSLMHTANVTGIGSDPNIIGRYQEAAREGRIVDVFLEDLSNAAVVAGPISKALGRTSAPVAAAAQDARLSRAAGLVVDSEGLGSRLSRPIRRVFEPDRPPTSGTLGGQTRPLSASGYQRPIAIAPAEVVPPVGPTFRVPGVETVPRRLPLTPATEGGLKAGAVSGTTDVVMQRGAGLAGYVERRANPGLVANVEPVRLARNLQRAGEVVDKFGLGAQYADPSDALLEVGGKVLRKTVGVGTKMPIVSKGVLALSHAVDNSERITKARTKVRTYLEQTRGGQTARESIDAANDQYTRAAIDAQKLVDNALKRENIDQATRDIYGGVVMAATDLAIDSARDVWNQTANRTPEVRNGVLARINEGRLDNEAITPEVIEAYNAYKNGTLPRNVAAVIDEGIRRVKTQSALRTKGQMTLGNIRVEDTDVPVRASDGTPLVELGEAERAAAFEIDLATGKNDVFIPYKPSLLDPKRQGLLDKAAELRTNVLPEQRVAMYRAAEELAATEAYRHAMPEPGTDVPDDQTPGHREEFINELADRRDAITSRLREALEDTTSPVADLDERINMMVRTIEQLDDDIAELRQTADESFADLQAKAKTASQAPTVKLKDLDDGDTVRELGERTRQRQHQEALDEHEAMFGGEVPLATPPKALIDRSKARGNKKQLVDGTWDYFAHGSAIWSGRRARKWYTMKGWLSKGGSVRGMFPDQWFSHVQNNGKGMAGKTPDQIVTAYLDSIDRIYETNRPAHLNDAVLESVALELDMDPELAAAALRSRTAYRQALHGKFEKAVSEVAAAFDTLEDWQKEKFLKDMASLDEIGVDGKAKAEAMFDTLGDVFEDGRSSGLDIGSDRDLFEHLMGVVDHEQLIAMLDGGRLAESVWRDAEDAALMAESDKAGAQAYLDSLQQDRLALGDGDGTGAVANSLASALTNTVDQINEDQLSLSQLAKLTDEGMMTGTNPTPDGQWEGGTYGEGVQEYEPIAFAEQPMDLTRPALSPADRLIEQEARRRVVYEEAKRQVEQTQARIDAYERRAANLEKELGRTRQDRIYQINRRGVASMSHATQQISTEEVGGYILPTEPGAPVILTGLIGRAAGRMGPGATELVQGTIQNMLEDLNRTYQSLVARKEMPLNDYVPGALDGTKPFDEWLADRGIDDKTDIPEGVLAGLAAEWSETLPEDYSGRPISFEAWLKRRDIAAKSPGDTNVAALALKEVSEMMGVPIPDLEMFHAALVAQDLSRSLDAFYGDNLMGVQAAWQNVMSRINHYTPTMRGHVSQNFINDMDAAMANHLRAMDRELNALLGERMAFIPATWRTPVQEANRSVRALLDEAQAAWDEGTPEGRDVALALARVAQQAPTSFDAFARVATQAPTHLIGGSTASSGVTVRKSLLGKTTETGTEARASSQRVKGFRANTLREYARIEADEMGRLVGQIAMGNIATTSPFAMSAFEAIPDAIALWRANNHGKMKMSQLEELLEEAGYSVIRGFGDADTTKAIEFSETVPDTVMDEAGYDRLPVDDPLTMGRGRVIDYDAPEYNVEQGNIRVMPTGMYNALREYQFPTSNKFVKLYDQSTQLWKTVTLALSVAWVTYNALGNALMAGFSAGLGPIEIVQRLDQLREALRVENARAGFGSKAPLRTAFKNDTLTTLVPGRLAAHGLSWSEKSVLMDLREADTRMGRVLDWMTDGEKGNVPIPLTKGRSIGFGKVTEFSYALNEFTDNMFRSSVYLSELDKRLRKTAEIPRSMLDERGNIRTDLSPDEMIQLTEISDAAEKAGEQATKAALNTMGDFTRLTPFERKYVKRIFPFYPWLRHQTAMTLRMPLTNPLRYAWMQSLSDMLSDEEDGESMMALMSGVVPGPLGGMISTKAANPFNVGLTSFGDDESLNPFDPKAMSAAINPLAKFVPEMMFGIDVDQGKEMSRPADQKTESTFGQLVNPSAMSRITGGDVVGGLGEGLYNLAGMAPQTKGLRDTALGAIDARPRYDDGSVIPYADNKPESLLLQLGRSARIPFLPVNMDHQIEVAEDKDKERARQARRLALRDAARSRGG